MKITVLTNNNHLWLLDGFQHLWNKYCSLPVTIYGFKSPNNLHPNFEFISLGEQLPAEKWSNGLLKMLDMIEDDYFILMLEDFWLCDQVDRNRIYKAAGYSRMMGDKMLRLDLSGNRAAYQQSKVIDGIIARDYTYNIVETPEGTPYQMSFQAAIWHKENLRKVLMPNESPWQSEIEGSKRVATRVLGTNPAVIKYQPVWQHNRWKLDKLQDEDIEYLKKRKWIA